MSICSRKLTRRLRSQTAKLLGKATDDIRLIGPDKVSRVRRMWRVCERSEPCLPSGWTQETVLPDEKLVTEAVGESTLKEDDILYLVFRKSGDTFEPIAVDDASLTGGV